LQPKLFIKSKIIYQNHYSIVNTRYAQHRTFFLDVHYPGAGKVTAKDVAAAHKKDLAVENKYGVNFIKYRVDEKAGVVMFIPGKRLNFCY